MSYAMNAVVIAAKGKPVTVDAIAEQSKCTKCLMSCLIGDH